MSFLLFGLTGGLASGKSTVAARFRERGVPVIDADQVAREVVCAGSDGLDAVVEAFGLDVLTADGELDRRRLASRVFGDHAERGRLNAILHPRIAELTARRAAELSDRGEPLACYEAALLVENGLADAFRPLVVASLPEPLQAQRAMARDGSTAAEAHARIAAQMPLAAKIAVADHVIDSSGTLEETRRRADQVLDAIRAGRGASGRRP